MNDLVELITRNAIANPNAIAVIHKVEKISYGEFWQKVILIAERITYIKPNAKVLVDLDQCIDAYLLCVGIMFAGGTYCPMNQAAPDDRREQVITDFDPDIIITVNSKINGVGMIPMTMTLETLIALRKKKSFSQRYDENSIAYVIYTSGSTGLPKGVQVKRKSLNKFLDWSINTYGATTDDVWAQFSYLSFDLSIVDIFTCLCSGAALLSVEQIGDKLRPSKIIEQFKVTIWHSVPSAIDFIFGKNGEVTDDLSSLRLLSFCGEPLTQRHVDLAFSKNTSLTIFNTYGPTEGTLFCTLQKLTSDSYLPYVNVSISIGNTIPGWHFDMKETTDSDIFDLIIYGEYIAVGYLGKPEDDLFFAMEKNGQIFQAFRTGDLIKRQNGNLYFYARKDRQVKIQGYRVEPGELDAVISRELKRISYTIEHGNALYTFIESDSQIDAKKVKDVLRQHIEYYKIPKEVYVIKDIPKTLNLKTDVTKLKEMIK